MRNGWRVAFLLSFLVRLAHADNELDLICDIQNQQALIVKTLEYETIRKVHGTYSTDLSVFPAPSEGRTLLREGIPGIDYYSLSSNRTTSIAWTHTGHVLYFHDMINYKYIDILDIPGSQVEHVIWISSIDAIIKTHDGQIHLVRGPIGGSKLVVEYLPYLVKLAFADSAGRLWLLERDGTMLDIFSANGSLISQIPIPGDISGPDELKVVHDIPILMHGHGEFLILLPTPIQPVISIKSKMYTPISFCAVLNSKYIYIYVYSAEGRNGRVYKIKVRLPTRGSHARTSVPSKSAAK